MAEEIRLQEDQEHKQKEMSSNTPAEDEYSEGWNAASDAVVDEPEAEASEDTEEAREAAPSEEETDEAQDTGEGTEEGETDETDETDLDPDEYRRLKAFEASMKGRMDALRREKAELELQLQQQQTPKRNTRKVEIGEDLQFLADDFKKKFPQLVDLLEEDSDEGKRVREALEEGGTYTAGVLAENVHRQREAETRELVSAQQAAQQHYQTLAQEHPEFSEYILGGDPEKSKKLLGAIKGWISESMTFAEGAEAMRVLDKGSTSEVSNLLGRFKKAVQERQAQEQQGQVTKQKRDQSAADGAAVRSRRQPARAAPASPNDYEAAWEEAVRQR
jgi:hypothetical protein